MIKRVFISLSLFLCFSLCTSCFEILEEIKLNKDGSGTIMLTLNMSKSKTKLASIMLLDSINGHKIPTKNDISKAFNDMAYHLEKTPGISNIKKTKDFDNYIFTVSCNFKNVDQVNAIFKDLIEKQNRKKHTNFTTTNFSYNKTNGIFNRYFTYDNTIKKHFNNLNAEDRKVFDNASYTCIYRFADKIKSVSNTNAKISPNKTAVFLKTDALALIMGKKSIKNQIKLSN